MEYIGFFNLKTKRVSKIYNQKTFPSLKKKKENFIFFHTHPFQKKCHSSIPSYQDILFTIENNFPFHYIFTYYGIYILKKEKNMSNLNKILKNYSEKKLCFLKNPVKKLNSLFQYSYLSFTFISYKKIKKNDISFIILQKLLKMEPPLEINVQIHPL